MLHEGQDSFTPQWAWEHPAMLGALGVLPGNGIDPAIMAATAKRLRLTWDFSRIWGWDYPTAAMCAARTLQPELAVDFLTMEAPTNRYLPNGCNFQRAGNNPVPAYFPGNGGLLAAVALMTAGWQSGPTKSQGPAPGFPKNRHWAIRAENFRPFL
jgi:protein-glucosylgalactosylhydroxylysine glucosidase